MGSDRGFFNSVKNRGAWTLLLISVFLSGQGCARRAPASAVTSDCVLPQDQTGTLSGRWKMPPVPVAFRQGDFADAEISEIIQAADTWNKFYSTTLKLNTIDYGSATNPRVVAADRNNAATACSLSIVNTDGSKFTGNVLIYKDGVWPYSNQPNAMALTTFCRSAGNPLPYFYMAAIEINYQNFFVSGKKVPDLQTIILHEFGHLMGLNHSCEDSGGTGVPNCNDLSISPDYTTASMYPKFGFDASGLGEQRRDLNPNDEGRANCLYGY